MNKFIRILASFNDLPKILDNSKFDNRKKECYNKNIYFLINFMNTPDLLPISDLVREKLGAKKYIEGVSGKSNNLSVSILNCEGGTEDIAYMVVILWDDKIFTTFKIKKNWNVQTERYRHITTDKKEEVTERADFSLEDVLENLKEQKG